MDTRLLGFGVVKLSGKLSARPNIRKPDICQPGASRKDPDRRSAVQRMRPVVSDFVSAAVGHERVLTCGWFGAGRLMGPSVTTILDVFSLHLEYIPCCAG